MNFNDEERLSWIGLVGSCSTEGREREGAEKLYTKNTHMHWLRVKLTLMPTAIYPFSGISRPDGYRMLYKICFTSSERLDGYGTREDANSH